MITTTPEVTPAALLTVIIVTYVSFKYEEYKPVKRKKNTVSQFR